MRFPKVGDPMQGLAYIVLFGLGSMIGMGALSRVIAVPLVTSARFLTRMNRGIQAAVSLLTIGIGITTIYTSVVHANIRFNLNDSLDTLGKFFDALSSRRTGVHNLITAGRLSKHSGPKIGRQSTTKVVALPDEMLEAGLRDSPERRAS